MAAPLKREPKWWSRATKKELLTFACGAKCQGISSRHCGHCVSGSSPDGRPYGTKMVSSSGWFDVVGIAADRAALLARLGSLAGAHGGAFRCQLATKRLDVAGKRSHACPGPDRLAARDLHHRNLRRGAPRGRFEFIPVVDGRGFLCRARFHLSRKYLDRGSQP